MTSSSQAPSPAELARTSLDIAGVATLLTRSGWAPRTMTVVSIQANCAGEPTVWLEPGSPTVGVLAESAGASLLVPASPPFRCLTLSGWLRPRPVDQSGCLPYEMVLQRAELVGTGVTRPVPVAEILTAEPDPLRFEAPRILSHMDTHHHDQLLSCAWAHGYSDVVAVSPRALHRYGFELAAICPDGVRQIRLTFPHGPVCGLEELPVSLAAALVCRCRRRGPDQERER